MSKIALRIAAVVGFLVVLCSAAAVAGFIPRGPMNHGWDWPWHDWWHSGPVQSELRQHGRVMTDSHTSGSLAGQMASSHELSR